MKISSSFNRKFFGDYVRDFFNNRGEIKIPDWEFEGQPVVLKKYDDYECQDKLRYYLKMFDDNFPKRLNNKGETGIVKWLKKEEFIGGFFSDYNQQLLKIRELSL